MLHKITRNELYELVWREPLSKLCKKYYISDVGLKKVLDRHNIPKPPVGYWNMKPQNQQKSHRQLPELSGGQGEDIVFEGLTQHQPLRFDGHALMQKADRFKPVQSRHLPRELNRIFTELRTQQSDKYGVVKSKGIRVAKKKITEAKQALGHLQQFIELFGWRLHVASDIRLTTEESHYRIELNERVKRSDNPRYGKYEKSGSWRDWAEKWLYTPSGSLTLSLDSKKFQITEGAIDDCRKILEYVLKTDQLRLTAAQEQQRQEEERKARRQLDGREKLKDKLQVHAAELLLTSSDQYRKWIDAKDYLSHLKTQDMSCLGEWTHLLEYAVLNIEPPNPEEIQEKLSEKEAELEAEFQKYVEDGWWPDKNRYWR